MPEFEVGEIVRANAALGALGLPYRAKIEALKGERVKVRPLHPTLTAGSARTKGISIRARWVQLSTLEKINRHDQINRRDVSVLDLASAAISKPEGRTP